MPSGIKIIQTDLFTEKEQNDFWLLMNQYATDIMGGGKELGRDQKQRTINGLKQYDNKIILLAYLEDQPVGIAHSFYGFSTFKGKKLINLHDLAVHPEYRGQGISQLLLKKLEEIAIQNDCCKITLGVLEGNKRALGIYAKFGFEGYELDPTMGKALFLDKMI